MLDRLVGGAVLAEPDGIVGQHIDRLPAHQRGEAKRRLQVVGKDQEGPGIGDDPAMQRHPVHRRGHAVFAHAVMDVAAGKILPGDDAGALEQGVVRSRQIGRPADQLWDRRRDDVEHLARGLARGAAGRGLDEFVDMGIQHRLPAFRQLARDRPVEPGPAVGGQGVQAGAPGRVFRLRAHPRRPPGGAHVFRHGEGRQVPIEGLARAGDLVRSQRGAMRAGGARLVGRAVADDGAAGDQRRAVVRLSRLDGGGDRVGVVAVDGVGVPAIGGEPRRHVVAQGERGRAVDRDGVVVEQHDQLAEAEMAGQRGGFVADPLHQVAVRGNRVGPVIDRRVAEAGGQHAFGERHADRRGDALAERAGRRLDPRRVAVFRVAGGAAAELAEPADLIHRHVGIAGQVEERIEQHRAVAGGQDEAVAVGPARRGRVEFQIAREQHRGRVGHPHRHARMAGLGRFHRVHGERADRVGHAERGDAGGAAGGRCSFGSGRHDGLT